MPKKMIYADQIVVGNLIVAPGRKRPVEIFAQFSAPEDAHYFEFAGLSANGRCALRLHRSEQVELVGHVED